MFGHKRSDAAKYARDFFIKERAKTFLKNKKIQLLELGAGLGRDTIYLAKESNLINITALDYSHEAIKIINKKKIDYFSRLKRKKIKPITDRIKTKVWDVRKRLPFKDNSFDRCFSHMLYCMALTTKEIKNLNQEVKRVLKPGGINIFTVRHIGDGDYRNGKHINEDLYQNDGFIVHFFSKKKIKEISKGFIIENISKFNEGKFPRKLFIITLRKK